MPLAVFLPGPMGCHGKDSCKSERQNRVACVHRVARLEKQIRVDFEELPPVVQDLKGQVDNFRNKLETTEHLSWLGE
jgi:succinate dehydrogenase/fumarate reductase-like Fe-S protein